MLTLKITLELDGSEVASFRQQMEGQYTIRPFAPEILPPIRVKTFALESEKTAYIMTFTDYGQVQITLDETEVFTVVYMDLSGQEYRLVVAGLLVDLPFVKEALRNQEFLHPTFPTIPMARQNPKKARKVAPYEEGDGAEWTVYGDECIGPAQWKNYFLFNWPDRSGPPLQVIHLDVDPWTYVVTQEHAGWRKYTPHPDHGTEFKITYYTYGGYGPPTEHTTKHEITVPYFFAKFDIE